MFIKCLKEDLILFLSLMTVVCFSRNLPPNETSGTELFINQHQKLLNTSKSKLCLLCSTTCLCVCPDNWKISCPVGGFIMQTHNYEQIHQLFLKTISQPNANTVLFECILLWSLNKTRHYLDTMEREERNIHLDCQAATIKVSQTIPG